MLGWFDPNESPSEPEPDEEGVEDTKERRKLKIQKKKFEHGKLCEWHKFLTELASKPVRYLIYF